MSNPDIKESALPNEGPDGAMQVADEAQLLEELDACAQVQFRKAQFYIESVKKALDKLDINTIKGEYDPQIMAFLKTYSEALVFLTSECLEFHLTDPKVVEYFKARLREIIDHPTYQALPRSAFFITSTRSDLARFIRLAERQ